MVTQVTKVIQMLDLLASILLNTSHGCQPKNDPLGCSGRGAPVVQLHLEGVPDIPWCKVGQTPKKDKCRNGSESGGLKVAKAGSKGKKEPEDFRGSSRRKAKKQEKECRNSNGEKAPCWGAPSDSKGGSTRLV
jgi:hypothetical protein